MKKLLLNSFIFLGFLSFFTFPYNAHAVCVSTGAESAGQTIPVNTDGSCPAGSAYAASNTAPSNTDLVNVNLKYIPLEPLAGVPQDGSATFCTLLNGFFRLMIFLGGLTAVGSFVYSGIMYMTSEVVGVKSNAKKGVSASLWGLMLLISSYIILNTINPQLLSCNQVLNPVNGYKIVQTPTTPNNCTGGVGTDCLTPEQQAAVNAVRAQQQGGPAASQADINTALSAQQAQEAQCVSNGGSLIPPGGLSVNSCRARGFKTCNVIAGPVGAGGAGDPYRCGMP